MEKNKIVCALLAHVDAGKTTLSEALLYTAGAIRSLGRVDHRDTFLDTDVQERERGITIFSKQAMLEWNDTRITFLDTPGHVDFSGETERTLQVLDCAVLLVSGADGVQGHTLTLWHLLEKKKLPVFIFINKMDQQGCQREELLQNLHKELSPYCIDMQADNAQEEIALCSEHSLSLFLENGSLPEAEIGGLIKERKFFPCYFGSALKLEGVRQLLDALTRYAWEKAYHPEFGAKIYKIERDAQGNRLTCMKITGGILKTRDLLTNRKEGTPQENVWEEKVNQIRLYSGKKYMTADLAEAGTVCAVTGLSHTYPGQGLGMEENSPIQELKPVFTYRVMLPPGCDPHTALDKLLVLQQEEPSLQVVWHERTQEIHMQLMGDVQLETLIRLIRDRFGLEISFSQGSILYQETIASPVEGVGHYEPLRHYAEVHLLIEPGERGSGIQVCSACSEDKLDRNWQRLIMTHVMEKRHLGVLTGSPLTDVRITLLAGKAHLKHTEGGDFRQATYRAIRQGLMQAQSILLEPWYRLRMELPAECLGRALSDIEQMGGQSQPAETHGQQVSLVAFAPVSKARGYARELAAYTKGRGHISLSLNGYAPCKQQESLVAAFGYDPQADLENSPDSIFCTHGAGYQVPWNEVRQHMHIDTEIFKEKQQDGFACAKTAPKTYTGSLEEDKELMAIYERTYGPIKPRSFRPVAKSRPEEVLPQNWEKEPTVLLVDGYNIIFAWEELKKLAALSLEDARKSLIDILCNYQGVKGWEIILVFDGYNVKGNPGEVEKYNNITVVYTKEAQTADSYLEKATHDMGKKSRILVASSDGPLQFIILGNGAMRIPAMVLYKEIESTNTQIQQLLSALNRRVSHITGMEEAMKNAEEKRLQAY